MFPKVNPTTTKAWKRLTKHYKTLKNVEMKTLFAENPKRFDQFSKRFEDILLDYSKNILTDETLKLLIRLAKECGLREAIEAQFNGEIINETEGRAVLHTALRTRSSRPVYAPDAVSTSTAPAFPSP